MTLIAGIETARSQTSAHEIVDAATAFIAAEQEEIGIPGVITAIVIDGEVVLATGFGMADVASGRPADENTRFRVGSISKPVTATGALMAMAEYGLTPETDLRAYFDNLPIRPELSEPLTFHQLLTHTAGFSESLSLQHVRRVDDFTDLTTYLQNRLPPRFINPGRTITYNDHHTTLAGYAIERLNGVPFHDAMRSRVFEPLGMTTSSFDQVDLVSSTEHPLAHSYTVNDDTATPYRQDLILTTPAAGLATTATDMGRYMAWLLAQDADHPQLTVQYRSLEQLRGRAYGFAETSRGGHLVLYKDGQANGFGARMLIVPELGLGVFVAVNQAILGPMGQSNEAGRFLRDYTSTFLDVAVPSTDGPAATPPTPLPSADSSKLAGTYRTTVAARHTWELMLAAMDTATVQANADGSISIGSGAYVPVADNLFQWHEGGPYYIGFELAEDGTPLHLFIGAGSYERVPWYGAMEGSGVILLGFSGAALLMLMGSAIVRRKKPLTGWIKLASAGSVMRLGFVIAIAATMILMDPQLLFYDMPFGLAFAVGIALVAIISDSFSGIALLRAQNRSALGTLVGIVYLTSTVVFVWWLNTWNLLGWQIG